jgi:Family of unknown function (DUF5682)
MERVRLYGIRHHGPGSARRVLAALEASPPDRLVLELPADATPRLAEAADADFTPPVALLAYGDGQASFYPFVSWSPEWVALRWALARGVPVEAFDRPFGAQPHERERTHSDALDTLARAAGRSDSESWWNDTFESSGGGAQEVFAGVASLMRAARVGEAVDADTEERESWMRVGLARALERTTGTVAVVCGAWHVPALERPADGVDADRVAQGEARRAARSVAFAWAPWSHAHIARDSGYGAGVVAPLWYAHLWEHGTDERSRALWVAQAVRAVRATGQDASPAQSIDSVRLSEALASVRGRAVPGFEEARDAVIASVLGGESIVWDSVAQGLLVGGAVGKVPAGASGSPVIADCDAQAEALRLPRAVEPEEWTADLRQPRDLARSSFLHRLRVLGVDWGKPRRVSGLGTFKEGWVLQWQPGFTAVLAAATPLGATVEEAAQTQLIQSLAEAGLSEVIEVARRAVEADLPLALGRAALAADAAVATTSDALVLAQAATSATWAARVGNARGGGTQGWEDLARRLFAAAAFAWPAQARAYDAPTARAAADVLDAAFEALEVAQDATGAQEAWRAAVERVAQDGMAAPFASAYALRRCWDKGWVAAEEAARVVGRALSPARPFLEAGETFEGFFRNPVPLLVHSAPLCAALDTWLSGLDPEDVAAAVAAFRRAFSGASQSERLAVWEAVFGGASGSSGSIQGGVLGWDQHRTMVLAKMGVAL